MKRLLMPALALVALGLMVLRRRPGLERGYSIPLYPLAPLLGRVERKFQPFVTGGAGGFLIQVDLDNIEGQTLYHSFQWSIGGGMRIVSGLPQTPYRTITFVELRVDRQQAWANRPLDGFRVIGVSVVFGMRI